MATELAGPSAPIAARATVPRVAPAEVALLASVFVVAACGLVYRLAAGAMASYLLGDSVLQFSTVIGSYLFAMGLGSWLSRLIDRQLVAQFLRIELLIGLIGGLLPAALFLAQSSLPAGSGLAFNGVAGLAAARSFAQQGIDDVHLLELEDSVGGNSRSHQIADMACPLGAHYLPLPGPDAPEVSELLHHLGMLRQELGRTVPNERHLCHTPQARLLAGGQWVEGLLPPADAGSPRALGKRRRWCWRCWRCRCLWPPGCLNHPPMLCARQQRC